MSDGICCQFQEPGQLVVSRQSGPVWPNRGNSFWVAQSAGQWYLFTWAPTGYRIPETVNVAAVCRACMTGHETAMGEVPREIGEQFGLIRLSDAEAEVLPMTILPDSSRS
jgi:hypothetical protein